MAVKSRMISFSTILITLLIVTNVPLFCQNKTIDSLKLALKNAKHDTTRCNILSTLIETASDDAYLNFNEQLKNLSENNIKSISRTHPQYSFFKKHIANSLNNIGFVHGSRGNYPKALEYCGRSLKIQEEIGDKYGIATSLNNYGYIYDDLGDIPKALEYYGRSLKIREEIGDKNGIAGSLNNIGFIYKNQGDIPKALEYYSRSLKIFEEIKDNKGISYSLNNIGNIYQYQGDLSKALEYFVKSLKIREEIRDKNGIAESNNNIGLIYNTKGEFPKALEYYGRSLKIREEIGDKYGIANSLINIGGVYKSQMNFPKALEYYGRSLKIREEIGDKYGIAKSLNAVGIIYIKLASTEKTSANKKKNYNKAIEFCSKSMKVGRELGFPENIRNAALGLSRIYKAIDNHKLALENYELYIQMRDSLNNIESQKASIKQQTKYEYDKQKAVEDEKHAAEIKQQEEKAAAEKKRQNIVIASVSIVLLLVAVFSVILFNRFRVTQKQKAIIEVKEKETQFQKHLIEEKHKEITDSINYAERIQRSFLATQSHLNQNLSEYFVLFKPKDVVSGDFYLSATLNNGNFALATADSTGHGVPGAIMSLLNITSLEKAIETETSPDKILNATRKIIIDRLKKDGSLEGGKDGMDCSLCIYDQKNLKLFVSAANNPIWIVRKPETKASRTTASSVIEIKADPSPVTENVIELKADKMPVGKHDKQDISFTQHEIQLQKGDVVYTLTDGFPDQFGGEKGKKFMSKNLRELLAKNSSLPMEEQRSLLEKTFKDWVGELEQVDDVTVIGIRI